MVRSCTGSSPRLDKRRIGDVKARRAGGSGTAIRYGAVCRVGAQDSRFTQLAWAGFRNAAGHLRSVAAERRVSEKQVRTQSVARIVVPPPGIASVIGLVDATGMLCARADQTVKAAAVVLEGRQTGLIAQGPAHVGQVAKQETLSVTYFGERAESSRSACR